MDLQSFDQPSKIVLGLSPSFHAINEPKAYIKAYSKDYALHLTSLEDHYAASFSAPSNSISLFDKTSLKLVHTIKAHSNAITSIRAANNFAVGEASTSVLISSGKDAHVKAWDPRTALREMVLDFEDKGLDNKSRGVLSFDLSPDGLSLVTGTELKGDEAHLRFWDVRNASKPTHTNTFAHSDDITTLSFSPLSGPSHVILSGSTDGLLCLTDIREHDEDESTIQVGNWGTSVAAAGWTGVSGSDGPGIWAHSDMETLSVWSSELDLIHDYGDLRKPHVRPQWGSDYFIDASWMPSSDAATSNSGIGELGVWTGSNAGDFALITLKDEENWMLQKTFRRGHHEIVRCVLWDQKNSILLTGGEDSQIAAWNMTLDGQSVNMDIDERPSASSNKAPKRERELEDDEIEYDEEPENRNKRAKSGKDYYQ